MHLYGIISKNVEVKVIILTRYAEHHEVMIIDKRQHCGPIKRSLGQGSPYIAICFLRNTVMDPP